MATILLIDDEVEFAACLCAELEGYKHTVEYLERAEEGPDRLTAGRFDVVLLDNLMPRLTGIEFLDALKRRSITIPVVLMTSDSSSETVIRAMNLGAFDYVCKPGDIGTLSRDLLKVIARAMELTRPPKEVRLPGQNSPASPDAPTLVGKSPQMLEIYKRIGHIARLDDPVLILGETGTGKELVANALHSNSPRKDRPFVAVNCSALTATLLESELFGHEKGAFTGADKLRKGLIEHAHGCTLFLDEIGEMPIELQGKLLRVLQEREIRRIGSSQSIPVDFRLLSATNRDLRKACRDGRFREDLYYRLNCFEIRLPPLRERSDDLLALVDSFLEQAAKKSGQAKPALSEEAMTKICRHSWPGNVRELKNTVRRAFGFCRGPVLLPAHLELAPEDDPEAWGDGLSGEQAAVAFLCKTIDWAWNTRQDELWPYLRDLLERELLRIAMERLEGNQSQIAERLGMVWNTVSKRIKTYGLK